MDAIFSTLFFEDFPDFATFAALGRYHSPESRGQPHGWARSTGEPVLRNQVQTVMHHQRLGLAFVLATIVAGAIGCHRGDLAARRTTMRGEQLGDTLSVIVESERKRPRKLTRSAEMLGAALSRDIRGAGATIEVIKRCLQRDRDRWLSDPPRYWPHARKLLEGKPENIERSAIILLF